MALVPLPGRDTPRAAARLALAVLVAAASAGCPDDPEIDPEDQLLAVGWRDPSNPSATFSDLCADPDTGIGRGQIVATVFATDGTFAEGVDVTFAISEGVLDGTTATTDATGEARMGFEIATRPAGQELIVSATTEHGLSDDHRISAPSPHDVVFAEVQAEDGVFGTNIVDLDAVLTANVAVTTTTGAATCHLRSLEFTLEYDPAILEVDQRDADGNPIAPDLGVFGEPDQVDFSVTEPVPGRIEVRIAQDPTAPVPPDPVRVFFARVTGFTFRTIALTPPDQPTTLRISSATITPTAALGGPYLTGDLDAFEIVVEDVPEPTD